MTTIFRHPRRPVSICLRLAMVALVAGLALTHASRQTVLANPADPVNVGTNPVRVMINYPPPDGASSDQSKWIQLNVATAANAICLKVPPDACQQVKQLASSSMLTQPLSTPFDAAWNKNTDKNGNTMLQSSCDTAKQQIKQTVASQGDVGAYDLSCNFRSLGTLTASITPDWEIGDCVSSFQNPGKTPPCGEQALVLTYSLPGNSISFGTTKPDICTGDFWEVLANTVGGGVACADYAASPDPRFTLSFDAEFDVFLLINNNASCLLLGNADQFIQNANLAADNYTARAAIQFKPELKSGAEAANQSQQIDLSSMGINLGSTVSALNIGCAAAERQGFQFDVIPDPKNGLTFAMTHPLDKAQLDGNGPPTPPGSTPFTSSLFTPEIVAAPTTVPLNGSLAVTGSNFPGSNSSQIQLRWADPGAEQWGLKESDVSWGTPGNLQQVTLPRTSNVDYGNVYLATNLKPNTKYQFSVRDCDNVTCSQWSDALYVTTAAGTSNQVSLYLDSVAQGNLLATAAPDESGSFTRSVQIPVSAKAGNHSLVAVGGNNSQSTAQITVLAANQTASPQISFVGGSAVNGIWSVTQDDSYSVQGSYFTPAGKVNLYLDSSSSQPLATATVGTDGSFQSKITIPNVANSHTLLAVETVNGQPVQTTLSLSVQEQPK